MGINTKTYWQIVNFSAKTMQFTATITIITWNLLPSSRLFSNSNMNCNKYLNHDKKNIQQSSRLFRYANVIVVDIKTFDKNLLLKVVVFNRYQKKILVSVIWYWYELRISSSVSVSVWQKSIYQYWYWYEIKSCCCYLYWYWYWCDLVKA